MFLSKKILLSSLSLLLKHIISDDIIIFFIQKIKSLQKDILFLIQHPKIKFFRFIT